jgi:hypothetical protein
LKNHYAAMAYALVVQDAAYGTLLRGKRQELHARRRSVGTTVR